VDGRPGLSGLLGSQRAESRPSNDVGGGTVIRRLVRRFTTRFPGVVGFEVLAITAQAPLFALAIAVALLGHEIAFWAIIVFFAQALVLAVILLLIETRREKQQLDLPLAGLAGLVTGSTPGTEGWGELTGQPGARRVLLERIGESLSLRHLAAFVLQNDSALVYDAIALRASSGRFDADALGDLGRGLTGADRMRVSAVLGRVDFDYVVALARAMHVHAHPATDGVLEVAFSRRIPVRQEAMVLLAQTLLLVGRSDEATAVLADIRESGWDGSRLLSDLINPFTEGSATSEATWLATLNQMYSAAGLEPLHLDPDATLLPFDRIRVAAPAGLVADGPLVSVVMSTFQPGVEALSAARAILGQTWGNLELLIMDDASGPAYDAALTELAGLDERVTVVRAETNGGTYVRRNDALLIARGDYVTIQDSDDWSHPRRLELQVRHLEMHPEAPANLLSTIRVSPELRFSQPRGTGLRLAEPSLLFRREIVLDRIGFFDSVRRGADSEYRTRIERAFDVTVPRLAIEAPVMLQRFELASLSGTDFKSGWTHPARLAYRSAYLAWQLDILKRGDVPRLDVAPDGRPFPAPPRISGEPVQPRSFRVVVAGDGRTGVNGESAVLQATLRASGLPVGEVAFLQLSSLRSVNHPVLDPGLQLVLNAGLCGEVLIGDEATADLLVIMHADAVLGLPRTPTQIRADRVVVFADPNLEGAPGGVGHALPDVEAMCRLHFGVTPEVRTAPRRATVSLADLWSE
jgi:O-antigen biosynthesis protein